MKTEPQAFSLLYIIPLVRDDLPPDQRGKENTKGRGLLLYAQQNGKERCVFLRTEFGYDDRKTGEYIVDLVTGDDPYIPPNGYEVQITEAVRAKFLAHIPQPTPTEGGKNV